MALIVGSTVSKIKEISAVVDVIAVCSIWDNVAKGAEVENKFEALDEKSIFSQLDGIFSNALSLK